MVEAINDNVNSIDANTTAIGTKLDDVLTTEGDILYRGSSAEQRLAVGAANRVLRSNGTLPSWGQVQRDDLAAGAVLFELIDSGSESSIVSLDIVGLSKTYSVYLFTWRNLQSDNDSDVLWFRTTNDGGTTFDSGASDYGSINYGYTVTLTNDGIRSNARNTDRIEAIVRAQVMGSGAGELGGGHMFIYYPNENEFTRFAGEHVYTDTSGNESKVTFGGDRQSAQEVDGFQLLFQNGNVKSVDWHLYGLRAA